MYSSANLQLSSCVRRNLRMRQLKLYKPYSPYDWNTFVSTHSFYKTVILFCYWELPTTVKIYVIVVVNQYVFVFVYKIFIQPKPSDVSIFSFKKQ